MPQVSQGLAREEEPRTLPLPLRAVKSESAHDRTVFAALAYLVASVVQAGWVPATAGQGGAVARWEVADKMGCEVTCMHLQEIATTATFTCQH